MTPELDRIDDNFRRATGSFMATSKLGEVLAAPADDFSNAADKPDERLRLMRRILAELLARIYYRVAGYL